MLQSADSLSGYLPIHKIMGNFAPFVFLRVINKIDIFFKDIGHVPGELNNNV